MSVSVSVLSQLINEIRKYRIKLFAIGHVPSNLSEESLNCPLKIMFNLGDADQAKFMMKKMGISDSEQIKYGVDLPEGEFICKLSARGIKPFVGRVIPLPQIDNISISKEEVMANNESILADFPPVVPRYRKEETEKKTEKNISELISDLLRDIWMRPFIASVQRGRELGLNNETIKKSYKFIISERFAIPLQIKVKRKGNPCTFYWLTPKGLELINKPPLSSGSGGKNPLHIFIQLYLQDFLHTKNLKKISTEAEISDVRTDVYGELENLRVVFEICCSTYETEHIKAARLDVDLIVFMALNKTSKEKLEASIYKNIPQQEKIKVCILYELLSCSDLSEFLGIKNNLNHGGVR